MGGGDLTLNRNSEDDKLDLIGEFRFHVKASNGYQIINFSKYILKKLI